MFEPAYAGGKSVIIVSDLRCALIVAIAVMTLLAVCATPVGFQDSGIKTQVLWDKLSGAPPTVDLNAPLSTGPEVEIDQKWWRHLDDSTLDVLIAEAIANNKSGGSAQPVALRHEHTSAE